MWRYAELRTPTHSESSAKPPLSPLLYRGEKYGGIPRSKNSGISVVLNDGCISYYIIAIYLNSNIAYTTSP